MLIEGKRRVIIVNDSHAGTLTTIKDVKASPERLYNVHLNIAWPFPYFEDGNRDDFYLLAQDMRRQSGLPMRYDTEVEKLLLGISDNYSIKYIELDERQCTLQICAVDSSGALTLFKLSPLDLEFKVPVDIRIKCAIYEYKFTVAKDENYDFTEAKLIEQICGNRDPYTIWRSEYHNHC